MMKGAWITMLAVALSTSAFAQDDDDDLAPLAPFKPGATKPKPKPKPKPRPVAPKPKPKPVAADDDLAPIAPIAAKGDLVIKLASPLSGAILSIDGKEIGALPLPSQSVPAGERTVSVKRPGYAAFVKKVLVPGGKTVDVEAKLTPVAAVLSVTSDVAGATVLLNGRSIGTAPLTEVEVPAGPAEVTVLKEGFREDSQKITFVAGRDYPVVVKFNAGTERTFAATDRPVNTSLTPGLTDPGPVSVVKPGPAEPITSKWYFWAAIAVGVAAVAAGTAAGVAASGPRPLTETDICGADGCDACIGLACMVGTTSQGLHSLGSF